MSLLKRFDDYILLYIKNNIQGTVMDKIMVAATFLGNGGIIWLILAAALPIDKPLWATESIVLLTLAISTIIGEGIIKHAVRRLRPCNNSDNRSLLVSKPRSYSFPSGHTLSSFASAGVLSIYFPQYRLLFIMLALLIGLSRMYLYVHYPTDVAAGILIGLLCSRLVLVLIEEGYLQKLVSLYQNIQ